MKRARYSRAAHYPCGPEGVYVSALGDADAKGPGWPVRSGPLVSGPRAAGVRLRFLWHLGYDTMVTSEWALPTCSRTTWRRCQLVFELRPAYDPKAYGFNCVLSLGICRHRSGSGTGTAIPGVGEGDHHSSRAWYALSKQIYAFTLAIFSQLDDIPEPQIRPGLAKGRTLGPLFRQTCRIYCNNSEKGQRGWSHLTQTLCRKIARCDS
jgi:hypothetical protein